MSANAGEMDVAIWHQRLGHLPVEKLRYVQSCKMASNKDSFHCQVCPFAKQIRFPFRTKERNQCIQKFDLLHIDIWGPYKVDSHVGNKYFLTIVDDFSRFTWIYLLKKKSESISSLKCFILQMEA